MVLYMSRFCPNTGGLREFHAGRHRPGPRGRAPVTGPQLPQESAGALPKGAAGKIPKRDILIGRPEPRPPAG